MPRRGSDSTRSDSIKNEEIYEVYVVDSRGKIRGEVRRYSPYDRLGEIMLYEIDIFGFVYGYISGSYCVVH